MGGMEANETPSFFQGIVLFRETFKLPVGYLRPIARLIVHEFVNFFQ